MCIIVENESDIAAFKDFVDDTPSGASVPTAPSSKPASPAPVPPTPEPTVPKAEVPPQSVSFQPFQTGSRIFASPLAKRLATEKGLDLSVRIFTTFYPIISITVNILKN